MNQRKSDDGYSRWNRVGLLLRRRVNVIMTAFTVALALSGGVLILVLNQQGELGEQQKTLAEQDGKLGRQASRLREQDRQLGAQDAALAGQSGRIRVATIQNCRRIHNVVLTLETIIVDGRQALRSYEHEGTITPEQLERALADNEKARVKLVGADCPPRSSLP